MAVQDNSSENMMGTAFANANAQQQQQQPKQKNNFSFLDTGALARAPMGRNPQGEILVKLTKAFEESFQAMGKDYVATVVPIDRQNTIKLAFSAIVICVQEAANKARVGFHTLILEGSAEPIAPVIQNYNGQTIEILRTPAEAYDSIMVNTILEQLGRQFVKADLINAGCCVVPTSFNYEDHNAVYGLGANAILAAFTELRQKSPDFVDMNLANAERDGSLTIRPTFSRAEVYDPVGLPIRSDVQIDLMAVQQSNRADQSLNNGFDRQVGVATVRGYMDLLWAPTINNSNPYAMGMQQQQYQKYLANFVITHLDPVRLLTIPAQLLALVSAVMLREDNAWIGVFRSQAFQDGGEDMHDIGAVNIEANTENNPSGYGGKVNTKGAGFRDEMLGKLIASTVKPGLVISMDVPEHGAQSWYNDVFSEAACGNANATAAIIRAADTLTNGAFSRFFNNGKVFLDNVNKIHLGYYMDRNGVKRDVRDVDYLAVANLVGEKDPKMISDWSSTYLNTNFPIEQRLHHRRKMLSGLINDPTITGFARRLTFTNEFIDALMNACRTVGLTIRNTTAMFGSGSFERPTAVGYEAALMNGSSSGLFNRDMGGFINRGNNAFGGFNRF